MPNICSPHPSTYKKQSEDKYFGHPLCVPPIISTNTNKKKGNWGK
jgi:hypothetical protein